MTLNDNTKRIIFIVVAAIVVLSILFPLVMARFEEHRAELGTDTITALWWAMGAIAFVSMLLIIPLVILLFYEDRLYYRINTIELARRARTVVLIIFWLILVVLALLAAKYLIVLYGGSPRIVYHSITSAFFGLYFVFLLLHYWKTLKYFRTQPPNKIIVACLRKQYEKFSKAGKSDKAYSTLVKACETMPDGVWLWCRLALFCERTRKNSAEADKYMARAEELVTTTKANSIGDKACYLDYLGLVNYVRGERDKGLEYIKQAIGIESKPYRTKLYEELLADSKRAQSGDNPPEPKTVT